MTTADLIREARARRDAATAENALLSEFSEAVGASASNTTTTFLNGGAHAAEAAQTAWADVLEVLGAL